MATARRVPGRWTARRGRRGEASGLHASRIEGCPSSRQERSVEPDLVVCESGGCDRDPHRAARIATATADRCGRSGHRPIRARPSEGSRSRRRVDGAALEQLADGRAAGAGTGPQQNGALVYDAASRPGSSTRARPGTRSRGGGGGGFAFPLTVHEVPIAGRSPGRRSLMIPCPHQCRRLAHGGGDERQGGQVHQQRKPIAVQHTTAVRRPWRGPGRATRITIEPTR